MSNVKPEVLKTLRTSNALSEVNKGRNRIHKFNVDFTDIDPSFTGLVTVHHPTQIERIEIGKTKSALLGGVPAIDIDTDNIAHIISTLDVVIDQKPEWLDVNDPAVDYDILHAIYVEYIEWVNSFRKNTARDTIKTDSQE